MARLFRLLRNARGVDRSHSLGPVTIAGRSLAPMENTKASPSSTHRTGSLGGIAQRGRERPWTLAYCPEQSPLRGTLQCPLQIARSPVFDRSALAQLLEPPYTDPYVRWCGRGGAARLPPIPISDPSPTSPLRHPGHAHALIDALAASEESRIVAWQEGAEAAEGEVWIERKSGLRGGPRLVQRAEQRQGSGEKEMRHGIISIGLDGPLQPGDRFRIGAELQLGDADEYHPLEGEGIAGRQAERLLDMGLGLRAATPII